jgi:hypothetical protein
MTALRDRVRQRVEKTRGKLVPVPTPEWPEDDGTVFVSVVSAKRFDEFLSKAPGGNGRAKLVAMLACDSAGTRHFADADAEWLGDEEFAVVDRIYSAATTANAATPKAGEDLEKNCETASGASAEDSRSS